MIDPLPNFDWQNLYHKYDQRCLKSGFDPLVPCVSAFPQRPASDRDLYYRLVSRFAVECSSGIALRTYQAMLYWKLYWGRERVLSQKGLLGRLRSDSILQQETQRKLTAITRQLPGNIQRKEDDVLQLVKWLDVFKLYGIQGPCTLAVRTTFLHFVYPDTVPIFDTQVLRAVGVPEKYANEKTSILRQYLGHAWQLASTYSSSTAPFSPETPVRVIDMALWVTRSEQKRLRVRRRESRKVLNGG